MTVPTSILEVRSKIWLEIGGEPVFGQGREKLLRLIEKTGSIKCRGKRVGDALPQGVDLYRLRGSSSK